MRFQVATKAEQPQVALFLMPKALIGEVVAIDRADLPAIFTGLASLLDDGGLQPAPSRRMKVFEVKSAKRLPLESLLDVSK